MTVLQSLLSEDFELRFTFIEAAGALRAALKRSPEVVNVRLALAQELISTEDIRSFVELLLTDFRTGERFEHDTTLCAVAAALESVPGAFADEFLEDLAQVNAAELRRPARVAKECMAARSSIAKNKERLVVLSVPTDRWECQVAEGC